MYELDKRKFGAFVAQLRKEKGYTQKELSERLLISDKAISKWETGTTIPDTALLIPLADILGVTVTELLTGERLEQEPLLPETVEDIVKTAITYNETAPTRAWSEKGPWGIMYVLGCLIGAVFLFLLYQREQLTEPVTTNAILTLIFGAYFCFFARMKLPVYYDQNKISGVHDGIVRMNIPGLHFNNSNWPYIVKTGRVVMLVNMVLFPVLALFVGHINRELWIETEENLHKYAAQSLAVAPGNVKAHYWLIVAMFNLGADEMADTQLEAAKRALTDEEYYELVEALKKAKITEPSNLFRNEKLSI